MNTRIDLTKNLSYSWPVRYTKYALVFTLLLIGFFYLFFGAYVMPIEILLFGFSIVLFFFVGLNKYSRKWSSIPEKIFYKKLFWHSFIYRLIFVGIMYLLTLWLAPDSFPFEINAADSWIYHMAGLKVAKNIDNGQFIHVLENTFRSVNDYGHPFYIGLIYYIFGPYTFFVRFFNVIWGSLTVIFIARIARDIYGESAGRLAGIIAMLMPAFLYYGGMHLKETFMIFLIMSVCYNATRIIVSGRFKLLNIAGVIIFSFSFFFYRGFLAPLAILCVSGYFFLNLLKKRKNKVVLVAAFFLFLVIIAKLISSFGFQSDISQTIGEASNRFDIQMQQSTKETKDISFDKVAVAPFILGGGIILPFPSLLDFEKRQLGMIVRYQNDVVRNIMYFFAFLGAFYAFRKKFKESSLILMFGFGYMAVIAISGVSFQARFQLPSLPFMIILMSAGIYCPTKSKSTKWIVYLIFLFVGIFAWNYFKMNIRGLI